MDAPKSAKLLALGAALILSACAHSGAAVKTDGPTASVYYAMSAARYAEAEGDYEKAIKLYAAIDDPYARLATARLYSYLNENDKALVLLNQLIEQDKYKTDAIDLRYHTYLGMGQTAKAISDAETLLKLKPGDSDTRQMLANLYFQQGRAREARAMLKELLKDPGQDEATIHYGLAKICAYENDLTCARFELEKSIEANPDLIPAYLELGRIFLAQHQITDAEGTYQRALESDPLAVEAHQALLDIYLDQQRWSEALVHVKTLYDIRPEPENFHLMLQLMIQVGRFNEALKYLDDLDKPDVEERMLQALANAGLKQWAKAIKALNQIPPEGQTGCEMVSLKASIMASSGDKPGALKVMEDGWQRFKEQKFCSDLGYDLANAYQETGRRPEAVKVAEQLLKLNPDDATAQNYLGYLWSEEGVNLPQAQALIEQALKQRPDDAYILDSMAWVLYRQGQSESAFNYIEQSLAKVPDDPILNEHMGDILTALGLKQKALDYYLKASLKAVKPAELEKKINAVH